MEPKSMHTLYIIDVQGGKDRSKMQETIYLTEIRLWEIKIYWYPISLPQRSYASLSPPH